MGTPSEEIFFSDLHLPSREREEHPVRANRIVPAMRIPKSIDTHSHTHLISGADHIMDTHALILSGADHVIPTHALISVGLPVS